jgi:hypothetical protein
MCGRIDMLFKRFPTYPEKNIILYRGITNLQNVDSVRGKNVGHEVVFGEYLSTTSSRDVALAFAGCGMDKNGAIMIFCIKPNHMSLLPLDRKGAASTNNTTNDDDDENEILLPRGTQWRMVATYKTKPGTNRNCYNLQKAFQAQKTYAIQVFEFESHQYQEQPPIIMNPYPTYEDLLIYHA